MFQFGIWHRVARRFVFKPKIPIWVNFEGPQNGKCWYFCVIWNFFTVIWYILWPFCNVVLIFRHFVIVYQEKSGNPDLATLDRFQQ
jgi:hypothetical protein